MDQRIGRQGGWVGMIVILLALVIVAWLAKDALQQYGLMSGMETLPKDSQGEKRVRGPGVGATEASPDVTVATPAPLNAIERARTVEGMVKEQAAEQAKRIDDSIK